MSFKFLEPTGRLGFLVCCVLNVANSLACRSSSWLCKLRIFLVYFLRCSCALESFFPSFALEIIKILFAVANFIGLFCFSMKLLVICVLVLTVSVLVLQALFCCFFSLRGACSSFDLESLFSAHYQAYVVYWNIF